MKSSNTLHIVDALTKAIVEHRLRPETKLVEQSLANQFGVSRTLVRQALYQLAQNRLVTIKPARGAFVAAPSIKEAQQVFAVRRMLEQQMAAQFAQQATPKKIAFLRQHIAQEQQALQAQETTQEQIELLGDFHVCMAELMGNTVLAEMLTDLISRCSLITRMYQNKTQALDSNAEHSKIVDALEQKDLALAQALMLSHLENVEHSLVYKQSCNASTRARSKPSSSQAQAKHKDAYPFKKTTANRS